MIDSDMPRMKASRVALWTDGHRSVGSPIAVASDHAVGAARSPHPSSYLSASQQIDRLSSAGLAHVRLPSAYDEADFVHRDEVVCSLLAALEARDKATCDHSRAVGMWSSRLTKVLGFSKREHDLAVLAGTLHDVGKISTPSEILFKPGPLDEREWTIMREHASTGFTILNRVPSLREIAPIVRAHHERIDGTGYPDGLVGDAIPVLSRILAVADTFHAMISLRPYRSALSAQEALTQLIDGRGTQWENRVVDAMVEIVQPHGNSRSLRIAINS